MMCGLTSLRPARAVNASIGMLPQGRNSINGGCALFTTRVLPPPLSSWAQASGTNTPRMARCVLARACLRRQTHATMNDEL
jgi:hypothetical protein